MRTSDSLYFPREQLLVVESETVLRAPDADAFHCLGIAWLINVSGRGITIDPE